MNVVAKIDADSDMTEMNSETSLVKLPELSVFFPCYNEVENIRALIEQSLEVVPTVAEKFEIVLVDDGSTDGTGALADELAAEHPFVRVVHQENGGYGAALVTGYANCDYEWIFFSDADLQFDLHELTKFINHCSDFDCLLGYRIKRADPLMRIVNAKLLLLWTRFLLGLSSEYIDINCAFKLIRKDVVDTCKPFVCRGAMITTELLAKIQRQNIRIKQIGVTHYPRNAGEQTGGNLGVIFNAIRETWNVRKVL